MLFTFKYSHRKIKHFHIFICSLANYFPSWLSNIRSIYVAKYKFIRNKKDYTQTKSYLFLLYIKKFKFLCLAGSSRLIKHSFNNLSQLINKKIIGIYAWCQFNYYMSNYLVYKKIKIWLHRFQWQPPPYSLIYPRDGARGPLVARWTRDQ